MSSSGIGPEQDPIGEYHRIEEVERIRLEQEKKKKQFSPGEEGEGDKEEESGLGAFLLLLMDKVVDGVKQLIKKSLTSASRTDVRDALLNLKDSFESMMAEDKSQDAIFLKKLSQLWQRLLEQNLHIAPATSLGKLLDAFIREIEKYPKNESHTFGYYLDEYAGLKWLPFPYMELIQKMHRNHEFDPESSELTHWVALITDMLDLLEAS